MRAVAWAMRRAGLRNVQARKEDKRVRLYSPPRNDLTQRFPLIVEALARRSRSCILDGEAVACGEDGIALFERIRYQRHDGSVFLYAFDLIELNGDDLRREPLVKAALARLLARAGHGVRLNAFRAELVFCAFKGPHGPGANNAGCEPPQPPLPNERTHRERPRKRGCLHSSSGPDGPSWRCRRRARPQVRPRR
jgi:ATP dependent DNA ligase domain